MIDSQQAGSCLENVSQETEANILQQNFGEQCWTQESPTLNWINLFSNMLALVWAWISPPVAGDMFWDSVWYSVGTQWWQVDVEVGKALYEFPRAFFMDINHISRCHYLKVMTLPELIRDKGLIWQENCIGKNSNKSRIWITRDFNLERNAVRNLYLLLKY